MVDRSWGWVISLFFLFILLSSCAISPEPTMADASVKPSVKPTSDEKLGWWYVQFRLRWPDSKEAIWYPDLLLADRVIGPILDAEQDEILLWRFHRRAARDQAGRQFSFIFRSSALVARRINILIATDPLLVRLQKDGVVETVLYDEPNQITRPEISDTSDPSWSPEVRAAWPYFIMGVSRLWLELILEIGKKQELPGELIARYIAIERVLNNLWQGEGGHVLLHHLSAVFGYRELAVMRRELMVF
ncbi:conserved exported hypothetical protein [Candidatus Competibacter denitrificans Run_A_D11]|uniref:Lipoprotein n=2 Tax=Candidatus Competibacter TaxID=221279 RepID=W6M2U9_9GAMM|nr:conserved exported hypothetical protein [Candidatus Competibacter denitrificans Run_A_D11]